MKLAYYSLNEPFFAVSRLRVLDPLDLLGPAIQVMRGVAISQSGGHREYFIDTDIARTADAVIVQRNFPCRDTQEFVRDIIKSGAPVIYETDDDLRIVPEWHNKPAYADIGKYIEDFARQADLVTVATSYLAERFSALNPNTVVLPNYLRHSLWQRAANQKKPSDGLAIGYSGNRGHWRDLEQIEDALVETSRRHPETRFVFLGCITDRLKQLPNVTYYEFHGVYDDWPQRLASAGIDIAVTPLTDCEFNNCISHIKYLELGYLAIPGIFSDLVPYRESVKHGVTGVLVGGGASNWLDALELLISDEPCRRQIGNNAHQAVLKNHLLEHNCQRWLEAYRRVL